MLSWSLKRLIGSFFPNINFYRKTLLLICQKKRHEEVSDETLRLFTPNNFKKNCIWWVTESNLLTCQCLGMLILCGLFFKENEKSCKALLDTLLGIFPNKQGFVEKRKKLDKYLTHYPNYPKKPHKLYRSDGFLLRTCSKYFFLFVILLFNKSFFQCYSRNAKKVCADLIFFLCFYTAQLLTSLILHGFQFLSTLQAFTLFGFVLFKQDGYRREL